MRLQPCAAGMAALGPSTTCVVKSQPTSPVLAVMEPPSPACPTALWSWWWAAPWAVVPSRLLAHSSAGVGLGNS